MIQMASAPIAGEYHFILKIGEIETQQTGCGGKELHE